jgi:H+-translocating NAD(P) transhydrogenase subunit alpha
MKLAVLRETSPGERRVALVPGSVGPLLEAGFEVVVEAGAGREATFPDEAYTEAGARVAGDARTALDGANAVLRVNPPGEADAALLPPNAVVIGFLFPLANAEVVRRLAEGRVSAFAMDQIPRTTRAQKMDALSSQATVAGYRAVLLGAQALGKFFPMLMTAAGTVPPARVLVLGAGVAGLQAIATARRLGGVVQAFDVRAAVKEQVQSLGATFLEAELGADAEGAGGYAEALSEEQHERELELIGRHITDVDVVITTAQIPGRTAPVLVTEAMVASMKPGSVIVDLASESGGNCEVTEAGQTVVRNGVSVLAPLNLVSTLPVHSSQMYSRNASALLLHLVKDGAITLDFEDEIVAGACVTHQGEIRHAATREKLGAKGGNGG